MRNQRSNHYHGRLSGLVVLMTSQVIKYIMDALLWMHYLEPELKARSRE